MSNGADSSCFGWYETYMRCVQYLPFSMFFCQVLTCKDWSSYFSQSPRFCFEASIQTLKKTHTCSFKQTPKPGGGSKYLLCSPLLGGRFPILTSIFFRWIGSTTNSKTMTTTTITTTTSSFHRSSWEEVLNGLPFGLPSRYVGIPGGYLVVDVVSSPEMTFLGLAFKRHFYIPKYYILFIIYILKWIVLWIDSMTIKGVMLGSWS